MNVASIIGFTGYSGLSVYGATKASMIGFTRSLAREVGRKGVNVNAVSKAGVTPFRAANGQGDRLGGVLFNKEGVELLLKHGADPKLGTACEAQNKCRAQ